MKQKHFIDSHKGVTALAILGMMALYRAWESPTAWVYLALHGTYGVLWVLKSRIFPDASWEKQTGLPYGLVIWAGLTLYWIAPWLLVSRGVAAPAWLLGLAVSLYGFGLFFHFAGDMQKHTVLRLRPGQLISDGLLARSRNINYFGELLIYLAFALLAMHWAPFVILALYLAIIWLPNMFRKEKALAELAGYAEYRRRSKFLIPFLL